MNEQIISQDELEVKTCADEFCGEPIFRGGLCLDHLAERDTAAWDDQDAEREMVLGTIGHTVFFGDLMEVLA